MSSFPMIVILKSFGNSLGNSWFSLVIYSGDNLLFYFSTISWLRLQQETVWVNIGFETRDLTSVQKSHPSPMILEKPLIQFNVTKFKTFFFHLFNTTFFCCSWKLKFKLLLPGSLSFSAPYQWWLVRQKLFMSAPSTSVPLPLLDMQLRQTAIFKNR